MKKIIYFVAFICISCSATDIETENRATSSKQPIQKIATKDVSIQDNILTFNTIEDADSILTRLESCSAEELQSFSDCFSRPGKYLQSLIAFAKFKEETQDLTENDIPKMLNNSKGLFHIVKCSTENSEIEIYPLSLYDYRCLVNDEGIFVVGDNIFKLVDNIVVICPLDAYKKLTALISKVGEPVFAQTMRDYHFDHSNGEPDGIYDLDYIYLPDYYILPEDKYTYEKTDGNHKLRVKIAADYYYSLLSQRLDCKGLCHITSYNKKGIAWFPHKKVYNVDKLHYEMTFHYDRYIYVTRNESNVRLNDRPQKYVCKRDKVANYPNISRAASMQNYGPTIIEFSISNQYLTTTHTDYVTIN